MSCFLFFLGFFFSLLSIHIKTLRPPGGRRGASRTSHKRLVFEFLSDCGRVGDKKWAKKKEKQRRVYSPFEK